jgi:hypothetical protein
MAQRLCQITHTLYLSVSELVTTYLQPSRPFFLAMPSSVCKTALHFAQVSKGLGQMAGQNKKSEAVLAPDFCSDASPARDQAGSGDFILNILLKCIVYLPYFNIVII